MPAIFVFCFMVWLFALIGGVCVFQWLIAQ
jgi:hypothetical protein